MSEIKLLKDPFGSLLLGLPTEAALESPSQNSSTRTDECYGARSMLDRFAAGLGVLAFQVFEQPGASWKATNEGLPPRAGIAALAVDPSNPQRLAAATYWYGIYLSTDGGASWELAARGMPDEVRQRLDDVDFAADGTLYASSHHGIWALSGPGSQVLGRKVTRGPIPATGVGDAYPAWVFLGLAAALPIWRRRAA